jgi:3-phenylpropionate/trans-cinnamate dioxygenase ferredoxin subunit
MADGWIDALGNVVCPLHKYRFELQRGRNVSGEGYRLKTYPVRQDAEGLHIGFNQSF